MSAALEPHPRQESPPAPPPASRMGIALLALLGLLLSLYLALHNLGWLGPLQCSIGSCEVVQTSAWAWFPPRTVSQSGVPVAALGALAYAALLGLALLGLQPRWAEAPGVARAIFGISLAGVLFSLWLTYLEAFVIHAWCQWCVVSAVLVSLIWLLSIPGLRRNPT